MNSATAFRFEQLKARMGLKNAHIDDHRRKRRSNRLKKKSTLKGILRKGKSASPRPKKKVSFRK